MRTLYNLECVLQYLNDISTIAKYKCTMYECGDPSPVIDVKTDDVLEVLTKFFDDVNVKIVFFGHIDNKIKNDILLYGTLGSPNEISVVLTIDMIE